MFYHLLYPLRDFFFGFNVFGYISFRAVGAALTALIISFLFGPKIIRTLQSRQIGETIRLDGPESHLKKEGTPTMGGIIVLLAVILPTFLWAKVGDKHILLILLATMWMGIIGFLDDYLKVIKKYPRSPGNSDEARLWIENKLKAKKMGNQGSLSSDFQPSLATESR